MIEKCAAMSTAPTNPMIGVSIAKQRLCLWDSRGRLAKTFDVSTSKRPPSCLENSLGTPLGLHAVAVKIGGDEPPGTVFKSRVPVARRPEELSAATQAGNLITSRILRLRGLEPGKNAGPGVDSFQRYIYIHGTNHEARIGTPFSGGCIEMRNADVISLFDHVVNGTLVWVE